MTLKKMTLGYSNKESKNITFFENIKYLYHGSYTSVLSPQIIKGKRTKDFGDGFYCTVIEEQAKRWARRYNTPTLNIYEILINNLSTKNLNILEFNEMTEEWLDFIVSCRNGDKHNYDIVIGPMADDQIYNYISDFLSGILTREQFWVLAKFKHPTNQVLFSNNNALEILKFVRSQEV